MMIYRLVSYFISAFLISTSIGLNAVLIPLALEENPTIFNPLNSTIILSAEPAIAIFICLMMPTIIRKMGIRLGLLVTTILRMCSLVGMAMEMNSSIWVLLSTLLGVGSFFCLLTIQLCINQLDIRKFKGVIYALFGTIISLGIAMGPVIYSHNQILFCYLFSNICELQIHDHSHALLISSLITFLFLLPLLWHPDVLPNVKSFNHLNMGKLIKDNKGVLLAISLCGISFFGVSWYITIYGIRNHLMPQDAYYLLTAFMLGSVCLDAPISAVSEYFDRRLILVYSALVCTIFAIFLPLAIYESYHAYILLFIWGGIISGMYSNSLTLMENKYGATNALKSSTVVSFMENLGATGGMVILGTMIHFIGTDGFSYTIIGACLIYFSFVLITYRNSIRT